MTQKPVIVKPSSDRYQRVRTLHRVADLINTTTNEQTLLRRVIREALPALSATGGTVLMPVTGGRELEVLEAQGIDEEIARGTRLPADAGIPGAAAKATEPVRTGLLTPEHKQILWRDDIRSEMAVAMRHDGELLGVLEVNSEEPDAFDEEDERLFAGIAGQAARMVQTIRLFDRATAETNRLERLFEVAQTLITPDPLPDLLNRITDTLLSLIDVKQCTVLLVNNSREMVLSAASGGTASYVQRPVSAFPSSLLGEIAGRPQPVHALEVRRPEKQKPGKKPLRGKPTSLLSIPIHFRDELVAVLNIYSEGERQFEPEEMRLLNGFALLCGIAIEHAQRNVRVLTAQEGLRRTERQTALSSLSFELAHEVRSPLTVISMLLEALREEGAIAPGHGKEVSIIQEKIDRIDKVVGNFLESTHRYSPLLEWLNLNEVVNEVMSLVQHQVSARRLMVRRNFDPELPRVPLDRGHIEQVLLSLVENAIAAMPSGGILTLETTVTPPRKRAGEAPVLRVVVRDTGFGMDPEKLERIFLPFGSRDPSRSGLGLFVAQKILAQYDGRIGVRSTPGEGSSFAINLPLPLEHGR